jgi:hypothetical protein
MRSDGLLPYEFEEEPTSSELTGHAGLLPYIDLMCVLGMLKEADKKIGIGGEQGWMDRQHVMGFVLLNLAGGENVEDIRLLESDEGLCQVVRQAERYGLSKAERAGLDGRFRRGRDRTFPSETRLYEYLNEFHNPGEEAKRVEGRAFIPKANEYLSGLCKVNTALISSIARHSPQAEATLDIDATLAETTKREALYCYDGYKAYQPLTTYWAQTGLAVLSEFRDGNVPAGYDMLRIVKESIASLPECVKKIKLRMDSAGYQHEVLRFCATGDEGRREVIEFTVSNDMTEEFRAAVMEVAEEDWQPLYRAERGRMVATGQEWAEVVYVPNRIAFTGKVKPYRYVAIRELVKQNVLPGMNDTEAQISLPFATVVCSGLTYRVKGIVTNRDGAGDELIRWHYRRCGKSEEAHAVMKSDLAGGTFPSGKFGANAAWWAMMVLAYNLHAAMRLLALPEGMKNKRLKGIRFALIDVPGRVVKHSRQLFVRLAKGHPAIEWLAEMRRKLRGLSLSPA